MTAVGREMQLTNSSRGGDRLRPLTRRKANRGAKMAYRKPCPKCGGMTDTNKHESGWGHLRKCRDCGWIGRWNPSEIKEQT